MADVLKVHIFKRKGRKNYDGNSTFVACDFSRQNACTDTGRMYPSSVSFP